MQKTSRREFLKITGLVGATAALAACVPAAAPSSAGTGAGAAPTGAKVELQWWSFPLGLPEKLYPHGKREQEWIDAYTKEHPEVTIGYQAMGWDSLTKMATSITAGNPPNLILRGGVDQIIYALQANVALEVELPQELKDDLPTGWAEGLL